MKNNAINGPLKLTDMTPLIVAVLATLIIVTFTEISILHSTDGVFMYPLDDPFIHMQVAKNIAFHQTWGINPDEFGSASSSVLYTLILTSLFKLFGANVVIPFGVNCIAAFLLLYAIHHWLWRQGVKGGGRTVILLLLVIFIPLPAMIISGMEHTLQCLFCFLFITTFADWLGSRTEISKEGKWKLPGRVLLYGILMVSLRYEGLFLVLLACLLLLRYKKLGLSIQLGAISALPVVLFGIYSMSKGSFFLPNSVLVKSGDISFSLHGIGEFFSNVLVNKLTIVKPLPGASPGTPPPGISLLATQRLLIVLPLAYLLFFEQVRKQRVYSYILLLTVLTTLLHLIFASTGWFYRYEAYLVTTALTIISVLVYKYGKESFSGKLKYTVGPLIILLFALLFPFVLRSAAAFSNMKQACINIYEQQCQLGQFVKKYHSKEVIAVNDIGAVSYYSDAKVVDLWGLGSIDVAKSKKKKYWTPNFLDSFVHQQQVKLAIVYDKWFDSTLLRRWTRVGTWRIYNNVICGDDVVSFYAIHPEDAALLKKNLIEYKEMLPPNVTALIDER